MESSDLVEQVRGRLRERHGDPVAHVVVETVWLAVVEGTLETGARLPTSREFAIALGVNPRSIARAYAELDRRGVTVTRTGAGTFVSLAPASDADRARHKQFAALCRDTVEHATTLGFTIDDLLDAIAEFRTADRNPRSLEP